MHPFHFSECDLLFGYFAHFFLANLGSSVL